MTAINIFKHSANTITLEPGDVVFNEGDPGDVMFAVVEGSVDILIGDKSLETVEAGGIVGELALVDTGPRPRAQSRAQPPGWPESTSESSRSSSRNIRLSHCRSCGFSPNESVAPTTPARSALGRPVGPSVFVLERDLYLGSICLDDAAVDLKVEL